MRNLDTRIADLERKAQDQSDFSLTVVFCEDPVPEGQEDNFLRVRFVKPQERNDD